MAGAIKRGWTGAAGIVAGGLTNRLNNRLSGRLRDRMQITATPPGYSYGRQN